MILNIILLILAIWLFGKFFVFVLRLAGGILKVFLIILGILLWPVSLLLLLGIGIAAVCMPVILICGAVWLLGKLIV